MRDRIIQIPFLVYDEINIVTIDQSEGIIIAVICKMMENCFVRFYEFYSHTRCVKRPVHISNDNERNI